MIGRGDQCNLQVNPADPVVKQDGLAFRGPGRRDRRGYVAGRGQG